MKRTIVVMTALALMAFVAGAAFGAGSQQQPAAAAGPYAFTIFADFPGEFDLGTKTLLEWIGEQKNVDIKLEIPPAANYQERLQLMLAGGDYPEVVLFGSPDQTVFVDAVKGGVVIPVNDYLPNAPNLMEYSYDVSWDSFKIMGDDKIYGLPRTSIARADGYIVRNDWLKNVGLSIPADGLVTLEEFREILKRFTLDDPNMSGRRDTYGLAASSGAGGEMNPQAQWPFGLIGWQKYPNAEFEYMNLQYSRRHDNYKQALAYSADLWKNGFIDPDWPVTRRDVSIQRFKQGVTGVIGEFAGWVQNYRVDMAEIQPQAELTYIVGIKSAAGTSQGGSFGTGSWGLWALTSSATDPAKIVSVFDFLLGDGWDELQFGLEGVTWNMVNGQRVPTEESGRYQWGRRTLRRNNDPDFFIPLTTPADLRPQLQSWIGACIDQAIFSLDRGFRPAAANSPVYIDYQTEMNQAISKIIVGDLPVSAWDAALEGWYRVGGTDFVRQMNDFIKSFE